MGHIFLSYDGPDDGGVMETKEKQRYYEQLYRETRASIEQYLRCLLHNSSAVEDVIRLVTRVNLMR